ncbi:MAG: ATP-binding cassette domain-containing protein [SAR324 cluster bacterium]|nr:ATP-binding cassette domain-containing protein [SAR324 cluster bacterium]MBF0352592.1 ATP-binding cassette domain-containing protein [SAR324 cluster bacterium]
MSVFHLENVQVSYKNTPALKNISLRIEQGEKIALIGPSGAGKTTLLQTLYERQPKTCAFVHQHYALVPQLSAYHNVYMGRLDRYSTWYNLLNLLKPQTRDVEEVGDILTSLQMREKMHERTGALSGGQQQRVSIARALFRGSPVLLADEPVSSIDPHQAGTVLELLTHIDKTLIMSLHAVDLALKYAQRIIGIREGVILFDQPSRQVSSDLLSALYQP